MIVLYFLLYVASVVCFVLAAFGVEVRRPVNLVALGLAFFALVEVIRFAQRL